MADTQQSNSPLRPSAAARWLNCPLSHRLSKYFATSEETDAARFGSAAHDEAERRLRKTILGEKMKPRKKAQQAAIEEFAADGIEQMVDDFVEYVTKLYNSAKETDEGVMAWFELNVNLNDVASELSGTADVVLYRPDVKKLYIVDLKTGHGVVDADDNPQLLLYTHGVRRAIEELGFEVLTISNIIYQSRLDVVKRVDVDLYELEEFIKKARLSAEEALKPQTTVGKPGPYCKYCPARHMCKLRAASALDYFKGTPEDVALLDNNDIEVLLNVTKEVVSWAKDVEERAKDILAAGGEFSEWEMRDGTSQRYISNEDGLASIFTELGMESGMMYKDREIKNITELDKLVPREKLDLVTAKTIGKPRLARKKDGKRQFIVRASSDKIAQSFMREIYEHEEQG